MKIAVLGTGAVGATIGTKLITLGHEVKMGSRTANNEKALEWINQNGERASTGTFANAAAFGEIIINCTKGIATMDILAMAGAENIANKILIDIANPLGNPDAGWPTLTVSNDDSLAEQIQRTYPTTKVVKALNTMWCGIMVNPRLLTESHQTYLSGNSAEAKAQVRELLKSFGWMDEEILDLGDITTARGTEMLLPLWLRVYGATKNGAFNFKIVK